MVTRLEEVIRKLESEDEYMAGYRPPPYLKQKLANVLREGEFRDFAELLSKALDDWITLREIADKEGYKNRLVNYILKLKEGE